MFLDKLQFFQVLASADERNLVVAQIVLVGLLIITAFVMGKFCRKLGFGETAGQILGGIIIGPTLLKLIDYLMTESEEGFFGFNQLNKALRLEDWHDKALSGLMFYLPIYLGIVLFTLTEECHFDRLKETGRFSLINSLFHTLLAFTLVFCGLHYLLEVETFKSAIIAIIASSSSSAVVLVALSGQQVEGRLKAVFGQSAVINALLELVLFAIVLSIFREQTLFPQMDFKAFVRFSVTVLVIGVGVFFLIKNCVQSRVLCDEFSETTENKKLVNLLSSDSIPTVTVLTIVWACVALNVGLSMAFHVPFTIAVIVTGLFVSNFHSQYIFDSLKIPDLMRLFHLVFFALIGARFDFTVFNSGPTLKLLTAYVVLRTLGKLGGSWLACKIFDRKTKIGLILPILFLPNFGTTGVSLTLLISVYLSEDLQLQTLVPAMILFELIGAALVKQAVKNWKTYQLKLRAEQHEKKGIGAVKDEELISFEKLIQDRVITDIDVRNKDDAIKMMCAELLKHGNISELQNILTLVQEREKLCPTGLGDEVALPHCRTADVDYPMAVCAFVPQGDSIDWDSPDGQGVRYIFLLISPINDPNLHIEAMKSITCRVMQPGFMDELYAKYKEND
ncbi:MAG: PTS sugar transporter subunit IIA [Lentisphaeraceae bacterium]|nr:PTS sugar transporter subunit IIA [Lentisphaeraceae bacterium]